MGNSVRGYVYVLSENQGNIDKALGEITQNDKGQITFPFGHLDYIEIAHPEPVNVGKYHGFKFWSWSKNSVPEFLMDQIAKTYNTICYVLTSVECDLDDIVYITNGDEYQIITLEPNAIHRFDFNDDEEEVYNQIYKHVNSIFNKNNIESIVDRFVSGNYFRMNECPLIRYNQLKDFEETFNRKDKPELMDIFLYYFRDPELNITEKEYDKYKELIINDYLSFFTENESA